MTRLHDLYTEFGQSPWIDNVSRPSTEGGDLQRLVDDGIRGVTSNPTIFQKAMTGTDAYDEQFAELTSRLSVEQAFWEMAIDDVSEACAVLRPVHDASQGADGFVSIEVSPVLARDTEATIESARSLHERIRLPNLLVKIPATAEGVPAIRQMIAEGRNINVTLIFSLSRYDGRHRGLSVRSGGAGRVERRPVVGAQRGLVFREPGRHRSGPPARKGGRRQASAWKARRPWRRPSSPTGCSRSISPVPVGRPWRPGAPIRNDRCGRRHPPRIPAYPDLLYVDSLIGPDTVNTMPDATVAAFLDHGTLARTRRHRRGRGRVAPRRAPAGRHRHGRRGRGARGRRGGVFYQELRGAPPGPARQGQCRPAG